MSVKMKGLMKGLRYISHVFENEEQEKEISIGYPTDVKHVAHIGWDGPSASSPSWMNDFKSTGPGSASGNSPGNNGGSNNRDIDDFKSQDTSPKKLGVRDSPARDLPGLPKSSRRQPSTDSLGSIDSPAESPKQSKSKPSRKSRHSKQKENSSSPKGGESSTSQDLPNMPKKSRRKKSKDTETSEKKSSSRSKEKGSRHGGSRHGSDDGSLSKHSIAESCQSSGLGTLKEDEGR